jgi:hypothetical protein
VEIDEDTSFKVCSKSHGCLDQRLLHVIIDAPTGKTICPSTLVKCKHGIEVTYLTELVGAHWVNVFWDGYHIQGLTFFLINSLFLIILNCWCGRRVSF